MKKIVQKEEKILRQVAKVVPPHEINSPKIVRIIEEMKEALANEIDGVGLAAPQIGYSLRIFIVAPNLNKRNRHRKIPEQNLKNDKETEEKAENVVYINPEIIKLSKEKKMLDEGCLSVRPLFGKVERSVRAKIRAYDNHGKLFESGASGLLAQIFQHEVDHLGGTLFIDHAVDIREMIVEHKITDEK